MAPEASEIDALRTALAAAEARAAEAEAQAAEAARERAVLANAEATIAALRLEIEKLRRALYGTQVGACAAALALLHDRIAAHVLTAERLHGDDTPVPVLAKGKTDTGRLWVYVRDDRPFGGGAPPAALYRYSRDRRGEHPAAHLAGWSGILQADAYAGFGALYDGGRSPRPVTEALCWAHARRKFFELADIAEATDRAFGVEDGIDAEDGLAGERRDRRRLLPAPGRGGAGARLAVRQTEIARLVADLGTWMRRERAGLSRHAPVAKAMDYMPKRWDGFAGFLADGRVCLTNNAAERALRGIALGRKAWLFAGSDRGGERAAFMYGLITTAKLNDVDPQAWLADVLARIAGIPASRLGDLLPWNWNAGESAKAALSTGTESGPLIGVEKGPLRR